MSHSFDDSHPIFVQIAEKVEDDIIEGFLREGDKISSTNEFAAYYQINPATAAKGINKLVDDGIIFKKRGVGMFVNEGAKEILFKKRNQAFFDAYVQPALLEARKINLSKEKLIEMIKQEGESK
ncbi:GntR family transcriptional regulator [Salicibibacter cibi]|uniref:GntR family transcriptional regulator n=1 Tax=Salicibibacter cibi TaxID=2743001 RepID=A0A7T7CEI1_9BACI|nr:GntR family transcriptional regulator [Salicibibacter cibi]QQK79067.1 GntR family transcriptional regulator [Salicibibacter cibi]